MQQSKGQEYISTEHLVTSEVPLFDPFLMPDDFRAGDNPDDYLRGSPWHPHQGDRDCHRYHSREILNTGTRMGNAGVVSAEDAQMDDGRVGKLLDIPGTPGRKP